MNASKLRDLIDKVIGKSGPLRTPAWWMRRVLQTIVDSIESVESSIPKVESSIPKVDSSMSDTSTNAVQNKAIKAYVDEAVANSAPEISSVMSDTSTNAVQNKVIKSYVDKAVVSVQESVENIIVENEKVTSAALNDLKSRIDKLSAIIESLQGGGE